MGGGPKTATLKDVAGLAGVSTATVARVLHGNGYVAEETRQLVRAAIAESGYRLNAVAQGLRKQRTFTLGHVLQSVSPNPFFAGVALGVEQEAARSGCGVLVVNTRGEGERERSGVDLLLQRRVDAILFTTVVDEANVRFALESGTPVVQVERMSPIPTLAVTVDNASGAREAMAHLFGLGHGRIAFIGVDPDAVRGSGLPSARRVVERERLEGYREALRRQGRAVAEDLIALQESYSALDQTRAVAGGLLRRPPRSRPTAVFAACDLMAAAVLQEAARQGVAVPEELSVVGFDDTYAPYLTPALTTVAQPMDEIGRAAARLALDALRDGARAGEPRTERLATTLVVRASTGPVAAGAGEGE